MDQTQHIKKLTKFAHEKKEKHTPKIVALCKKDIYKEQLFSQTEPETRFCIDRCQKFEQNVLPKQFHQTGGQEIFFQEDMELPHTNVLNLTGNCDHWMKPVSLEQHLHSSSQFDDANHKTRR